MATRLINRYHFLVDWGGIRTEFLEVSGLEMAIEVIAVREGSSKVESENKIPGLLKFSDVSFTRAIQKGDNDFFNWINTRSFGTVERRDVRITLLNERHEPLILWRSEEHTSELQSRENLVCRLLLEKKNTVCA